MKNLRKKYSSKWLYYCLVFLAWVVYTTLTLAAPATQNSSDTLQLSDTAIFILRVTLLVPYMLTWLVAVIGWDYFSRFAADTRRKKLPNSVGFSYLSRGLGLLIFDLILIPLFSAARTMWGSHEHTAMLLTVISNYAHIAIPLLAFGLLYIGSRKLAQSGRYASGIRTRLLPALVATSLFISLFVVAVFSNTSRHVATRTGQFASYYVSDPVIVLTIIVPLAITWLLGLQAALNTERYMHSLLQPRWRKAIIHFFHGLLAVVSSSIILQGVAAFGSQQLEHVSLALLLVIIYLFIFLQAIGYMFIKIGAKQLRQLIKAGVPHETN